MRKFIFFLAILVTSQFITIEEAIVSERPLSAKKLIEWGQDTPSARYLRNHLQEMAARPFDGVVINPTNNHGEKIVWNMWGNRKFLSSDFDEMVTDLLNTPIERLSERFIRVNVTPGDVDWFDDPGFNAVANNFAVLARAAKLGRCKGLMFDVEQYTFPLFEIPKYKLRRNSPISLYKEKVRERGRQIIRAITAVYPDIVIIFPWSNAAAHVSPERYALLPSFLDGIIDESPPSTRLVDGTERAYHSKTWTDFENLYKSAKGLLSTYSSRPDQYAKKMSIAFGLWVDAVNDVKKVWDSKNDRDNYFTPEEFRTAMFSAFSLTDEYVWVYSERLNWWEDGSSLSAYDKAIRSAREDLLLGRPFGDVRSNPTKRDLAP